MRYSRKRRRKEEGKIKRKTRMMRTKRRKRREEGKGSERG